MNISSIQSKPVSKIHSNTNNIQDKRIQTLEKQKQQICENMKKLKENKANSKTKNAEIKRLQEQMKEIDAQINKIKIENMTQKQNVTENKKQKNQENQSEKQALEEKGFIYTPEMTNLINSSLSYSELGNMKKVKTQLEGELRTQESGIKNSSRSKGSIMEKIEKIDQNMIQKFSEINKELQETSQEDIEKAKNKKVHRDKVDKYKKIEDLKKESISDEHKSSNNTDKNNFNKIDIAV